MPLFVFDREEDVHYALRAVFTLAAEQEVSFQLSGLKNYNIYLDGSYQGDGPSRFAETHPQYNTHTFCLSAGRHVIAVLLHYTDVASRVMNGTLPPFFYAEAAAGDGTLPLTWKMCRLDAFDHDMKKRMAMTLDYIDWCDCRALPTGWTGVDFDDTSWMAPRTADAGELPPLTADPTRPVKSLYRTLEPTDAGTLVETFGYERDEISARFFLREQDSTTLPPQGLYRRYDLGQVGLWHPRFLLKVPAGATVEIALSEQLSGGRVSPYIGLTGGTTCNMTHFVAAGGVEEFLTLSPHGGRYMELHVITEPEKAGDIEVLEAGAYWRTFFGEPVGTLKTGNAVLDHIYTMCINTLRGCTEDVVCDCPIRERGQWIGDSAVVGLFTASYAYGDMQVIRKSLREAIFCTDENGVLPAMFPGQPCYFLTYSLAWVRGLWEYYRATGDASLIPEVYPAMERFMAYMETVFDRGTGAFLTDPGFIDWGYLYRDGKPAPFVSFLYAEALRCYEQLEALIGRTAPGAKEQREAVLRTLVAYKNSIGCRPESAGYHNAVSLILADAVSPEEQAALADYIQEFMLSCFPNNEAAPRLYSPTIFSDRVITPYFNHYAYTALIKAGRYPFVLSQIEQCWGYMAKLGDATCLEVFDTRWSHCHQWSTCPLWILSTGTLGLCKREDLGSHTLAVTLQEQPLTGAQGAIALADGEAVFVEWHRDGAGTVMTVTPEEDVRLLLPDGTVREAPAGIPCRLTL